MQWNQKTIVLGAAGALVLAVLVVAGTRAFDFTGSAGIYPIQVNRKFGFIDKSGKVVVVPQFDDAGIFREGLAPVAIGKLWGYADKQGRLAITPQFDIADPFSDGVAMVGTGHKLGYIHRDGRFPINP